MESESLRDIFLEMTDNNLPPLKKVVDKYKPDLIISSYFLHSQSLARWKEQKNKKYDLWTVVADPWTVNPISFVKGADLHLVYDEVCFNIALKYGIDPNKILKTGWWVRQREHNFQKSNLQFPINNGPVIFFGGGSLGTNAITKFLPILLMIKQKCTIIFNTGTDKLAFKMVAQFVKMFDRLNKNKNVKIINLGWIENMTEILSQVDIVFGKAGPNFLFDVVAARKPFVAITHIGGQEDGNIELIKKKKLGWVKEGLGEAEDFLLEYLKNPEKYNQMYIKSIEKEASNNEKTMEKIWDKILRQAQDK
jgi:UDP-N-acetylglucosamine:LPS N-acetylglucosamine transferase